MKEVTSLINNQLSHILQDLRADRYLSNKWTNEENGLFKIDKFSNKLASVYKEGPKAQEKAFISTLWSPDCHPHFSPHQEAPLC